MTTGFSFLVRATRKAFSAPAEAFLLLRMAGWILLLSAAVKVWSLPRALRLLSTKTRVRKGALEVETQEQLADAVDLLLQTELFILRPICWKRAAVLHRYLALNGIATQILFGVRRGADGNINGHAWLEADGKPILETTAPGYVVTYAFPSNDPFDGDHNLLAER